MSPTPQGRETYCFPSGSVVSVCLSGYSLQNLFNTTPPSVLARSLKICRYCCRGLKMCMPFDCNSHKVFCYFFCSLGLKHLDTVYLSNATSPTVLARSLKTCRYCCRGLKMCVTFDCNSHIVFFVTFFAVQA